jgi:hypothetical protein
VAPRKRNLKKRASTLDSNAQAWLRGEPCGFFKFKSQDELEALWNAYGDADSMFWRRGMMLPITREELEANEDAWINSGAADEYGASSYFTDAHYTDDEKAALWNERGDKTRYDWRAGMRRPAAIA